MGAERSEDRKIEKLEDWRRIFLFRSSLSPHVHVFFIAGVLFLSSFGLYISTLAPSVVTLFDDSLEFQLVAYQLGIAHPTGYPLYTIVGKFFTFLPIGNVAYRMNLMSAFFGAVTVALLYRLISQIAKIIHLSSPWPIHLGAIIGAAMLAVSPVFWRQATVAEVYTLNACFVVSLLLLATVSISQERGIVWLAFLTGLSLTHHRTILLLLPALALYLYLTQKSRLFNYRILISSILWGVLPLLFYLYLPLRGHIGSLDGTYHNSWAGFWQQVNTGGYEQFLFDNPFGHERDLVFYWRLLENQFYVSIPGFIGILYLLQSREWKILLLTGVAFVTYVTFNLLYKVSDIEVFFIPAFLIWAIWSGVGAAFLLQVIARLKHKRWRLIFVTLWLAMFVLIIFQLFQTNYRAIIQNYTWKIHDYGLDILQQPLPSNGQATIVGILGEMTLLRYFQRTEYRRPDIETIAADLETERLATVERKLAQGKTVYLTRELPGAPERWSLNGVGPLIRVDPKPVTIPPDFTFKVGQAITPEITLLGYNLTRPPHTAPGPGPVRLTLFWQATAPLIADLKVSARLFNSTGGPLAVTDAVPVHFAYPTTTWRPGEIVSDVYDLILPADAPSGSYIPLIIWYDPAQNAAEVGRIELGAVMIEH